VVLLANKEVLTVINRQEPSEEPFSLVPPADNGSGLTADRNRVFDYFLKSTQRNPKLYELSDLRKRKFVPIYKRLLVKTNNDRDAVVQIMCEAIDALVKDEFHSGKKTGQKWLRWEVDLFGSWEKFERWYDYEV
jgi:hypothetical protein